MIKPPDMTETAKALVVELQRLPGSDPAMRHLLILLTLFARRTKYLNLRAGLMTTAASFLGLFGASYAAHGWADIPAGKLIFATVGYVLALAVVLALDYHLQHRPLGER